jgi:hypothetical protein
MHIASMDGRSQNGIRNKQEKECNELGPTQQFVSLPPLYMIPDPWIPSRDRYRDNSVDCLEDMVWHLQLILKKILMHELVCPYVSRIQY